MDKMQEVKAELEKMMESKNKVDELLKDMPMEGMEGMKAEWDKMSESMERMKGMMDASGM